MSDEWKWRLYLLAVACIPVGLFVLVAIAEVLDLR